MTTYGSKWPTYAKMWDAMVVNPSAAPTVRRTAQKLVDAKDRYQRVAEETGVPWYMIAVIHQRESDQDWRTSLAQGDRWDRVSTHVPRGRGPFRSWEEAAVDALHYDGLDKVRDWRLEKIAYYLERYNGTGYEKHGVPSPYLWSKSNQYSHGKYVADGTWSPTAVDQQIGCMPLLKSMMIIDPTINPERES